MDEFKSNSHKSKSEANNAPTEKKRLEPVAKGKVIKKKETGFSRLRDAFVSEDAGNVKSFIFGDVLIPALKKVVDDMISEGVHMFLYGGARGSNDRRSNGGYVSYRDYSGSRDRFSDNRDSSRTRYNYGQVYFDTRGEAEDVLSRLDEVMDQYHVVSVLDLYDLSGYPSEPQDNKYGWTNIRSAYVERTRDGYTIRLPKPTSI